MQTDLANDVRASIRDLILVLADSKRLLGVRYAGWILGAPELEAGIACASMAQDEWGHGRLLYALLKEFGDDVDRLEHSRAPAEYCSIDVLDAPAADWPALVALNALVDTALSVQFESLRDSSHAPVRQRVDKILDEERFHAAHGAAWFRSLTRGSENARDAITRATRHVLPGVLRWFGPDSARARALQDASVSDAVGSTLRQRYLQRVAPLLAEIDVAAALDSIEPDFARFDEATRRAGGAPDEETIRKVRGDHNRAFLMD